MPAGPGGGVRAEQDDGGGHRGPHHRGVWPLPRADHRHGQQDQDFERVQLMNGDKKEPIVVQQPRLIVGVFLMMIGEHVLLL